MSDTRRYNNRIRLSNNASTVTIHSPPQPHLQTNANLSEPQLEPFLYLSQKDPMAFFSEEIALHIFQLLSPADLGKCACVSRLWYRLVNDQMLWRRLFFSHKFIFPRGLNTSGAARSTLLNYPETNKYLKRRRSLHTVDSKQTQVSHNHPCWKALYRLNYNWIMGQARVSSVSALELSRRDQSTIGGLPRKYTRPHSPIVQFKGSVILISSSYGLLHLWRIKGSTALNASVYRSEQPEYWQTYQSSRSTSASSITCISLDTSCGKSFPDWQKVMVGYDSGHFSVFEYSQRPDPKDHNDRYIATPHEMDDISEEGCLREIGSTTHLSGWSQVGRIVAASFHYPILITCSHDGVISMYIIQQESKSQPHHWCRLLHRLYGTATDSPIGVSLERINSKLRLENGGSDRWRTIISFGLELHDGSWTVRLQETEFDENYILRSVEIGTGGADTHQDGEQINAERSYSFLSMPTSTSTGPVSTCISSTDHARIGPISTISISWPFVVTTHSDNTLNVFHMVRKSVKNSDRGQNHDFNQLHTSPTSHKKILRFQHLSTLYGHCGAVSSVSIESRSGRLVSASMDRSIKVWTMTMKNHEDQLEQRRVHQCSVSMSDINKSWTEGGQVTKEEGLGLIWVGSDDEKIVSMNCDGTVKVWHFS